MIKHAWFDVERTLYRVTPELEEAHKELRYKTFADVLEKERSDDTDREYERLYQKLGGNSVIFTHLGKSSNFWAHTLVHLDITKVLDPDPTIASTIRAIADNIPVSLFSNLNIDRIKDILHFQSIDELMFTHVLTGDDVQHRKPHREGFEKMIELSGVPAGKIIFIGDRVKTDIIPAKKLGMQTCLIYDTSSEADMCADTFETLLEILPI